MATKIRQIYHPFVAHSAGTGTSVTYDLTAAGSDSIAIQTEISAEATVTYQGRLNALMAWHTLATHTASDIDYLPITTFLRVTIVGNTGSISSTLWV